MFIEDLSTEAYFARGDHVRAIGWLEGNHPYLRGPVPEEFLAALKRHVASAYQPVLFLGPHRCTLCSDDEGPFGIRNLLIPTPTLLYVSPELVLHYVEDHGYKPPDEFIAAVLACPDQNSPEFEELLRACATR